MELFNKDRLENRKVTIYRQGEMFGTFHKTEARAYYVQTGNYAQYANAVECFFIPKGGRTAKGFSQTYRPTLLILDGWGHPDPAGMWGEETVRAGGVSTKTGRHSAFSEEWRTEFDALIGARIAGGAQVLADFRGHDSHAPATTPAREVA